MNYELFLYLCLGFQCSVIIEGEPLFLTNLQQPGRPATNYVCGRNGGIRFER